MTDTPTLGPLPQVCNDTEQCCRELARVWQALGVTYNGRSASENVGELRAQVAALTAQLAEERDRRFVVANSELHLAERVRYLTARLAEVERERDGIVDCGSLKCPFEARAEAAEARLAQMTQWLEDVIAKSEPAPPGGQHVAPTHYQMSISTRQELKRLLAASTAGKDGG